MILLDIHEEKSPRCIKKKDDNKNSGKLTIDDLYDMAQKRRPVKNETSEDKGASKNSNKEQPPSLMRRKSSLMFIAFSTMNFLNGNKKSNQADVVPKK